MCFIEYLSYPIFHGVNRFFVLTFNINVNRFKHEKYCLPTKKTEDYKVMIDEKNTLGQPIKDDIKTTFKKLQLVKEKITQLVVCIYYHFMSKMAN